MNGFVEGLVSPVISRRHTTTYHQANSIESFIMEISDIEKHINELIRTQESYHVNDPRVYDLWDQMTEILTQDIHQTIAYFQRLSPDKLSWVGQVFPDIMEKTNSKDYLYFLKTLVQKFPESDFRLLSEEAISYYKEE